MRVPAQNPRIPLALYDDLIIDANCVLESFWNLVFTITIGFNMNVVVMLPAMLATICFLNLSASKASCALLFDIILKIAIRHA